MGQPGCNDVIPTDSGGAYCKTFTKCNECHDFIPIYIDSKKPKAATCIFFGLKNKIGTVGPNGCETYKPHKAVCIVCGLVEITKQEMLEDRIYCPVCGNEIK